MDKPLWEKDWFGVVSSILLSFLVAFFVRSTLLASVFLIIGGTGVLYFMWLRWFVGLADLKLVNKYVALCMGIAFFVGLVGFVISNWAQF